MQVKETTLGLSLGANLMTLYKCNIIEILYTSSEFSYLSAYAYVAKMAPSTHMGGTMRLVGAS